MSNGQQKKQQKLNLKDSCEPLSDVTNRSIVHLIFFLLHERIFQKNLLQRLRNIFAFTLWLVLHFILFSFIVSGFPIALSYPHFYKSHPSLLEAVNGLKPDPKKHESYFYIQPKSGLPVDLAFRFQINMALQEIGHMARVEKFSNFVLPLLWFEIVSIDEYR